MRIGIPKEIKDHEYRVGMIPAGVRTLVGEGHAVYLQAGAGEGSGLPDEAFRTAGATILPIAEEVYAQAEMIVKVKEPLPSETPLLREGQILFTFLHLAADLHLTRGLIESGVTAIAYETVEGEGASLPILVPMSEVAGRMSVILGAQFLQKRYGGEGILLGGVPGVLPGKVLILGGGTVGRNALQMAVGLGGEVTIVNRYLRPLQGLDEIYRGRVQTLALNEENVEAEALSADLVIGAVLIPGSRAPYLIRKETVSRMKKGAVIVDVSIDQGGCVETSRPTTHSDPVYTVDGVLHYCVANIPGIVPRTSTFALCNATIPYVAHLAGRGMEGAFRDDPGLAKGLNIDRGRVAHRPVAEAHGLPFFKT